MTDLDLDRLGDVWRQRPSEREMAELRRSAEEVSRRAAWGQRLDLVSALVVAGVVLFLILSNPKSDTLLVGGAAILILLVSQVRTRRLRQEELRGLTGTTEEMLDQSLDRLRATRKRMRLQLLLLVPGFAFGLMVARLVNDQDHISSLFPSPRIGGALVAAAVLLLIFSGHWLYRSLARTAREEARLAGLREAWRQEQDESKGE